MTSFFNTRLSGETSIPPSATAMLVMLHGMAEHRGRYDEIARFFSASDIATCRFDQRGHGLSVQNGEVRGDVASFDDFIADAVNVLNGVRAAYPTLPIFIWGHSMGAVIATLTAQAHSKDRPRVIRGVITSSPPIAAFDNMPRIQLSLMKWLSRIAPKRLIPLPFNPDRLSRDAEVGRKYAADPLIPKAVTLRLLVGLAAASARCPQAARNLAMPWLAMHGTADRIAPPLGSQRLFDNLRASDKEISLWPDARHEVHNELEPTRTDFLKKIVAWIKTREA